MEKINAKLNYVHVCDYASFSDNGKINILGIFESIMAKKLPAIHPQMFIVSNISIGDNGNHEKVIKILSQDNIEISKLNFQLNNIKIPTGKKYLEFGVMGQMNGVKFDNYGTYKIQVLINGVIIGEKELNIVKV